MNLTEIALIGVFAIMALRCAGRVAPRRRRQFRGVVSAELDDDKIRFSGRSHPVSVPMTPRNIRSR